MRSCCGSLCHISGPLKNFKTLSRDLEIFWGFYGQTYFCFVNKMHYSDAIMNVMASQFTGVSIVCWPFVQVHIKRKHQSSASLVLVREIHRWPHKGPVTPRMFLFDDLIMGNCMPSPSKNCIVSIISHQHFSIQWLLYVKPTPYILFTLRKITGIIRA